MNDRYEDLGLIGTGGMAEVRRVRDRTLGRELAMKILLEPLAAIPKVRARFLAEAQATAQLEHPGIVPVHEMGTLPDGRLFFTMKIVRGKTLGEAIDAVHHGSPPGRWGTGADGWTLHRLVDAWRRICEAVAHAHARGVVHRDLKPDNVMVGAFGEVLVLDWGIAKVGAGADEVADLAPVEIDGDTRDALKTRMGTIAGTPAYMSPEQALGRTDQLSPASDVYTLGAILWEILYGTAPYAGDDAREILAAVRRGAPPPARSERPLPEELVALVTDAMGRDPADRPAHAGVLAEAVTRWQEGAQRRERALQLVAEADALIPQTRVLRDRAAAYRAEAEHQGRGIDKSDPIAAKRPVWELEDQADRLEAQAELDGVRVTELLQAALTQDPGLPEARRRLADVYRANHEEAEGRRDRSAARRWEHLLRSADDGRHAAYLQGDGAVTVVTDPPGAEVVLLRYELHDRRLEPVLQRTLGTTPLRAATLPMGSWLLLLRKPGHHEVRYPVSIVREQHWDGVRPGDTGPLPIRLPRLGELGEDEVYVPAGWFTFGGDPETPTAPPARRLWVDGFAIHRDPVTNARYIAWLDELVATGGLTRALSHAPRERSAGSTPGAMVYGRNTAGRFVLRPDADGDAWLPEYPVLLVDWHDANAFAEGLANRTGLPWRLPGECEWEKAARGVDGRFFPWGDFIDPTWAAIRGARAGAPLPEGVGERDTDASPYGMRGAAGNCSDWCADAGPPGPIGDGVVAAVASGGEDATRVTRGGAWSFDARGARITNRRDAAPQARTETLGFRLARSLQ